MIELILAGLVCGAQPWVTPEMERYTTQAFDCNSRMFNVIDNAIYAAEEYYWTPIKMEDREVRVCQEYDPEQCTRAPCGGAANCAKPYLAETAICWVEETDCWFGDSAEEYQDPIILRTFVLECAGSINCKWGARLPADFCCELLEVIEEEIPSKNSC